MPVLVVIEVAGGNSALDDVLGGAWYANGLPAGNRLRVAGPMDGGWRIVSLWDDRKQFERFLDSIHMTLEDSEPRVTFWEIEKVHTAG